MGASSSRKKSSAKPRGFTFTISIILLSLTLIAVALFSQEWRRMQQVSYNEVMPSETARLQERISSDFFVMYGADASVQKQSPTSVQVDVKQTLPYKKEGAPLAEISDYASSLPSNLRDKGYEPIVDANNMGGSTAKVMTISDSGSLTQTNDGANDISTYFHPAGWIPQGIKIWITCAKAASSVGPLILQGGGETADTTAYYVVYKDLLYPEGKILEGNYPTTSSVAMNALFPDGTNMVLNSNFLGGMNNFISLAYTKSPGAYLILPFDQNDSNGAIRDYSPYAHSFTKGGINAPVWQPNCKLGGCYSFDGTRGYISGPLAMTETPIIIPTGSEMLSNNGFENYSGDPESGYSWESWTPQAVDPNVVSFEPTSDTPCGNYALMATSLPGNGGKDYMYQTRTLLENTRYTLSFYAKGSARYSIVNAATGQYLQGDGTWGGYNPFEVQNGGSDNYQYTERDFTLPLGSTSAEIQFYAPASEDTAYYDCSSLVESVGLNGGFEYYHKDSSRDG